MKKKSLKEKYELNEDNLLELYFDGEPVKVVSPTQYRETVRKLLKEVDKLKCCGNCKSWGLSYITDGDDAIFACQNAKVKEFVCVGSGGVDVCENWEMKE